MKQMKVDAIENGTVIDHITAGKAVEVFEILDLKNFEKQFFLASNLSSKKYVKKDMIKIENKELSENEFNVISLIAPKATVSIIKNEEVFEKKSVKIPDSIIGVAICPNSKCITNVENVKTKFIVHKNDPIELQCHYCEKKYQIDQVKIKI